MRTIHQRSGWIPGLTAAIAFLWASSALAVVNRWTTHWPQNIDPTSVAIDPLNADVVYAGTGSGVLRSGNGGLTWSDPSNGALDGVVVRCVAIDPETSSVHLGTPSGILASTDGGATWSNRLAAKAIYNIVFGSAHTAYAADFDDVTYYATPRPSTLYKSPDEGNTWQGGQALFNIVPGTLLVDPTQPATLYAAAITGPAYREQTFVHKSVDGGLTWTQSTTLGGAALAIDPQNPATIYYGSNGGVFKSVDGGSTWTLFSSGLLGFVTALAVDPLNSSTIYAGANAGVARSTDGGATWTVFNAGLGSLPVSALAIDRSGSKLHVTTPTAVFDYQVFSGALDLSVGSDNKTRLVLTSPDAHLTLRTFDHAGNSTSVGPYGPYSDWSPIAVADNPDGLTRVLWNNVDGSAALWFVNAQGGNQASYRLGPVPGWTAVDVASGSLASTHVLWTHEDDRVGLWTVDNSGHVSYGPTLGPYPGWTAVAIADGADGLTRLLWNKTDGSAGLSLVGSGGLLATYRYSASSGWRAIDVAVGADGQSRILWTSADGRMELSRVDDSGNVTAQGPVYDAPSGFTAQRISAAPDGSAQVLWTNIDGSGLLWRMSADNVYQQSFPVGGN
ncbi:MAG TPA: sialidase family protein [Thermoanaerobaculia bacterium]